MEMQRQREMLTQQRKTQLMERRALRNGFKNEGAEYVRATSLKDVTSVTSRPGFLQQQLKTELTPLRRWYLQLKLLQDKETTADVETLLSQEKSYDVVYREGVRVKDVQESLLDDGAPTDVKELLCFSTRRDNFIVRVFCINDHKSIVFSSSQYIYNLHPELTILLTTEKPVSTAISFIHKNIQ